MKKVKRADSQKLPCPHEFQIPTKCGIDSRIHNDPNDWAREHNQPRYILDLPKRIVRVSLETMKIVNLLPALNERK